MVAQVRTASAAERGRQAHGPARIAAGWAGMWAGGQAGARAGEDGGRVGAWAGERARWQERVRQREKVDLRSGTGGVEHRRTI
jgi:hypothetical protein